MCHTPHHPTGQYPLWNRLQVLPADAYLMYDSITFDMGEDPRNQAKTAVNSLFTCTMHVSLLVNYRTRSETDTSYDLEISGALTWMTDLTDDHPTVSITQMRYAVIIS